MRVEESVVEAEGGSVAGSIDIPLGDPRRLINGFAIPASWSVMKMTGIEGKPIVFSCEALGVGPMNKTDCFNYIKANQSDEFYSVPVLHGNLRRTVVHGKGSYRVTIPSSWMATMAPRTGSHRYLFLCVNDALEPRRSFTHRQRCVEWVINNTPWEVLTVIIPLGDPRRIIKNVRSVGCVPPASWTVLINPENTICCYEEDGVMFTHIKELTKYVKKRDPKE